jgi:murein L,D-transpeptidase YcbB/YkuD
VDLGCVRGGFVGLIALFGGLAAPVSAPVARPPAELAGGLQPSGADTLAAGDLAKAAAAADVKAFYAARKNRALWIAGGRLRPEAARFVARLADSGEDGLRPPDYDLAGLLAAIRAAAGGAPADLLRAELMLSEALAAWGSDLHRTNPAAPIVYTDPGLRRPAASRAAVLAAVGAAPSLTQGVASVARMNPIYERLRAALAQERARGGARVDLILANLERARGLPADLGRRYILVDVAAQRLWTYENGLPIDSMKVVVGKPAEPTPQIAALVRYAVFRPYWNVPPDLVAKSLAPKVLSQGLSYFRGQRLEVLSDWTDRAAPVDPDQVDWRAAAAGRTMVRVRQLPGPDNMMGRVKFMFPNEFGVYLHDSPLRFLFADPERLASSGCVRLEDAHRLARWLLGEAVVAKGEAAGPPETRVDLAAPVPVYILYFTAMPAGEGLDVRRDVYRRDAALIASLAPSGGTAALAADASPGAVKTPPHAKSGA